VLVVMGVIGMTVRQMPGFAFRTPADYGTQMGLIHDRYDASLGPDLVGFLERLGIFHLFTTGWFSGALVLLAISIVICTLDRTPRLWRQSADIRVVQPEPFFDPLLPERAALDGVTAADVRSILRRRGFSVRQAEVDGTVYLYGDRHRWVKMATLLTHLGLIGFLTAAAVTSLFGFESGILLATGESQPIAAIGTPGLLVVKSFGFEAPRRPDGSFADFTTDLAVYQDGRELARKVIRVNDPLTVAGYTFHQNGFRPAPDLVIRDAQGAPLWVGPYALQDSVAGSPHGILSVPGRDVGLEMLLTKAPDGTAGILFLPNRPTGAQNADGTPEIGTLTPFFVAIGATGGSRDTDFYVEVRGVQGATVLIAKRDPGANIVWLSFALLILGIGITFYFPRRRVWARRTADGALALVARSDRYVDVGREFGRLLEDLVGARRPPAAVGPPGAGPATPSPVPPTESPNAPEESRDVPERPPDVPDEPPA
jgi:cytochrome c biogenesis protein